MLVSVFGVLLFWGGVGCSGEKRKGMDGWVKGKGRWKRGERGVSCVVWCSGKSEWVISSGEEGECSEYGYVCCEGGGGRKVPVYRCVGGNASRSVGMLWRG